METVSELLALCERSSPATGEFPSQSPVTRSFDVFFELRLNKWLCKQSMRRWFETPSRPLWRHGNGSECNDQHQSPWLLFLYCCDCVLYVCYHTQCNILRRPYIFTENTHYQRKFLPIYVQSLPNRTKYVWFSHITKIWSFPLVLASFCRIELSIFKERFEVFQPCV